MKLILMTLLVVVPALSPVSAENLSPADAQALAKKENKPVLIDFYAVWCGPCKMFDRDVKRDPDIKKILQKVVLLKVDAEKGDGIAFARKYGVTSYPTYVLTDPAMSTIHRWTGYSKPFFIESLGLGLEDPRSIKDKIADYDKQKTWKTARFLADYYASVNQPQKAVDMWVDADKLNTDAAQNFKSEILQAKLRVYMEKKEAGDFSDLSKSAKAALAVKTSPRAVMDVAYGMIYAARKADNQEALKHYLTLAEKHKNAFDGQPRFAKIAQKLHAEYLLHVEGNKKAAIQALQASYPQNWRQDPEMLNAYSWWCFENNIDLKQASELAAEGVKLSDAGGMRANILDTRAEIENARGNVALAVSLMEEAVKNNPQRKYFKKQLERFKKRLAEMEKKNAKS